MKKEGGRLVVAYFCDLCEALFAGSFAMQLFVRFEQPIQTFLIRQAMQRTYPPFSHTKKERKKKTKRERKRQKRERS